MSMLKIAALAAALALPALVAPAAAQSLNETHERVWSHGAKGTPAGYRPLDRKSCKTVAPIHIAGKTPVPMHAQARSVCDEQIAMKTDKSVAAD